MGMSSRPFWADKDFPAVPGSVADHWRAEYFAREAELQKAERKRLADALADAKAVWLLADQSMPDDLKTWCEQHHIPEFAKMCWRSAFVEGWRTRERASGVEEASL